MRAQGINLKEALAAVKAEAVDPAAWAQRTGEIRAVIDQIEGLSAREPELAGKVDATKVGVAGHSFGAYSAMLIAGVEPEIDGTPKSYRDDRVAGFVLLSPQGVGQQGLTVSSFQRLDRPTLVMTGTLDEGRTTDSASGTAQTYQQKLDPYRLAPAGDKTSVVIDGANHFTFSGPGSAGALTALLDNANDTSPDTYAAVTWATLRFWDQVLKGSGPGLSTHDASAAPATIVIETR
jgi:predicted dienelactone hydrolase